MRRLSYWAISFSLLVFAAHARAATSVMDAHQKKNEAYAQYAKAIRKFPGAKNKQKRIELFNQIVRPAVVELNQAVVATNKNRSVQIQKDGDDASEPTSAPTSEAKTIKNREGLDGSGIKPMIEFQKKKKK